MTFFNGRKKSKILMITVMIMALVVTYALPMTVFATGTEGSGEPPAASVEKPSDGDEGRTPPSGSDGNTSKADGEDLDGEGSGDKTLEDETLDENGLEKGLDGIQKLDFNLVVPLSEPTIPDTDAGKTPSQYSESTMPQEIKDWPKDGYLKVSNGKDGQHGNGDFTIKLSFYESNGFKHDNTVDWELESEGYTVKYVVVKGQSDEHLNVYAYEGEGEDGKLMAPLHKDGYSKINHVEFYYTKTETPKDYSISLVKEADKETASPGDKVEYTFTITNEGDAELTDIELMDEMLNPEGEHIIATHEALAPGKSFKFTKTYEIPVGYDEGVLVNTATVSAIGGESTITHEDSATVNIAQPEPKEYSISLEKKVNKEEASPGDWVKYTFTITNTGTKQLKNIVLKDEMLKDIFGNSLNKKCGSLGAGKSIEVKGFVELLKPTGFDHMIPLNYDEDELVNTATVSAVGGNDPVTAEATATVKILQNYKIILEKTTSPTAVAAGEKVTYTFKVTNEGKKTLHDVWLTDPLFGDKWGHYLGKLKPGEEKTYTKDYTVPSDYKDSTLENTATATGFKAELGKYGEFALQWIIDNTSGEITDAIKAFLALIKVEATNGVTIAITNGDPGPVEPTSPAAISLTKTVSPAAVTSKTATVTYTFLIENTGGVDLYGIRLGDADIGYLNEDIDNLAVGGTTTVAIDFNLSQLGKQGYGAWEGNTFTNVATVTGCEHGEEPVFLKVAESGEPDYCVIATDSAIVTYNKPDGPGPGPGPGGRDDDDGGSSPSTKSQTTIPDQPTPAGPVSDGVNMILEEEAIPAGELPKTGGTPALLLYGLGALLAGSGLVLRRKEKKM